MLPDRLQWVAEILKPERPLTLLNVGSKEVDMNGPNVHCIKFSPNCRSQKSIFYFMIFHHISLYIEERKLTKVCIAVNNANIRHNGKYSRNYSFLNVQR